MFKQNLIYEFVETLKLRIMNKQMKEIGKTMLDFTWNRELGMKEHIFLLKYKNFIKQGKILKNPFKTMKPTCLKSILLSEIINI